MSIKTDALMQPPDEQELTADGVKSEVSTRDDMVTAANKALEGLRILMDTAVRHGRSTEALMQCQTEYGNIYKSFLMLTVSYNTARFMTDERRLEIIDEGQENLDQAKMSKLFGHRWDGIA